MMMFTSPEATPGTQLSPAVEGGIEAKEEAKAEGHEERGHHRHHCADSQAKLRLHHLYLTCHTTPQNITPNCDFTISILPATQHPKT